LAKRRSHKRYLRVTAWAVHLYTAMGLPLALGAAIGLIDNNPKTFFLWLMAAVFVDATDGTLARRIDVKNVLPEFDGRRLDDLVDFITFAFLPALGLWRFEILPPGAGFCCALPLLASAYGFCQTQAKTEESFVGFPSYWNILLLYLVLLSSPPWVSLGVVVVCSALVFVPIHYIYPTRAPHLQSVTLFAGYLWAAVMVTVTLYLGEPWTQTVTWISLAYPVYYLCLSWVHHVRITKGARVDA
jgi:phosphatidylcholine synthase